MANYVSVADVAVTASQFDLTSDPVKIPAQAVADGYVDNKTFYTEGYKVKTADGDWHYLHSGDWVVVHSSGNIVMKNVAFTALFTTPA